MKIIGYRRVEFNTPDGNFISGITFYVTFEGENSKCFGLMTDKVFVSDKKLNGQQFDIGYKLYPVYNRFGKIQSVSFDK